jgi:hypothetical protein
MLKKMRAEFSSTLSSTISPSSTEEGDKDSRDLRKATVQDIGDEDDEDMDRQFAPGGDADYFVEEDHEGRFFGGGLTNEQKDILNIFDSAGREGVVEDVRVSLCDEVNLISLNSAVVSWKNYLSQAYEDCFSDLNAPPTKIRINGLNIPMTHQSKVLLLCHPCSRSY